MRVMIMATIYINDNYTNSHEGHEDNDTDDDKDHRNYNDDDDDDDNDSDENLFFLDAFLR